MMKFGLQQVVGAIGVGTFFAGALSPLNDGSKYAQIESFLSWGGDFDWGENWHGITVLAILALSVYLIWKAKCRWLVVPGAIALYLTWSVSTEFHQIRDASLTRPGFEESARQMGLTWSLWIVTAGAVLLVLASIVPDLRGNDHRPHLPTATR